MSDYIQSAGRPGDSRDLPSQIREAGESAHLALSAPEDLAAVRATLTAEKGAAQHPALPEVTLVDAEAQAGQDTAHPAPESAAGSDHFSWTGAWHSIEHLAQTAGTVAEDLGKGAVNEVVDHPGTLLKDAAIGLAVGAAIGYAPVLAIPALLYGGYELYENRQKIENAAFEFGHDLNVINDSKAQPAGEQKTAETSLEGFGAMGAQLAAGIAGGIAGGYAGQAVRAAVVANASAASEAAAEAGGPAQPSLHLEDGRLVDDSGALKGFQFQAIAHNGVQDFKDSWTFNGTPEQAEQALKDAGLVQWKAGLHVGQLEFRLPTLDRDSIHFAVDPSAEQGAAGQVMASGDVHGFEYYPSSHMLAHFFHDVLRVPG
jgi:hypothetical protein